LKWVAELLGLNQ